LSYDLIHNDSDIEIGHNVDTSVQCGPSTLSPLTNTEIAIILCNKDIDDDYEDEFDFPEAGVSEKHTNIDTTCSKRTIRIRERNDVNNTNRYIKS
jgi:hypothetical protein